MHTVAFCGFLVYQRTNCVNKLVPTHRNEVVNRFAAYAPAVPEPPVAVNRKRGVVFKPIAVTDTAHVARFIGKDVAEGVNLPCPFYLLLRYTCHPVVTTHS